MPRRFMVAGNWKMNGTLQSVGLLLDELKRGCELVEMAELVVLPPFVFLAQCKQALLKSQILWGAQNVADTDNGAYTGEISASMLLDFHCTYVLVGHSERRTLYGETNQRVAEKFKRALTAGLHPILCVGETAAERDAGKTLSVVQEQLAAVLSLNDNLTALLAKTVIAYEPVWAIGTGRTASPEQAQTVHAAIRAQLAEKSPALADEMRILYGGSVKPDNAAALFSMPDIDGGLIGAAALNAEQFLQIGLICNKLY